MSKLAQAVERAVREMREASRKKAAPTKARKGATRMGDDDFDDGGGFQDEEDGLGTDEGLESLLSGDPDVGALQGDGATETTEADGADDMTKKRTRKAKRQRQAGAEPKPPVKRSGKAADRPAKLKAVRQKVGDALAGLHEKPKNAVLFVNTAVGRALLYKLLKAAVRGGDLTDVEQVEAKRLIARLEARGEA